MSSLDATRLGLTPRKSTLETVWDLFSYRFRIALEVCCVWSEKLWFMSSCSIFFLRCSVNNITMPTSINSMQSEVSLLDLKLLISLEIFKVTHRPNFDRFPWSLIHSLILMKINQHRWVSHSLLLNQRLHARLHQVALASNNDERLAWSTHVFSPLLIRHNECNAISMANLLEVSFSFRRRPLNLQLFAFEMKFSLISRRILLINAVEVGVVASLFVSHVRDFCANARMFFSNLYAREGKLMNS